MAEMSQFLDSSGSPSRLATSEASLGEILANSPDRLTASCGAPAYLANLPQPPSMFEVAA